MQQKKLPSQHETNNESITESSPRAQSRRASKDFRSSALPAASLQKRKHWRSPSNPIDLAWNPRTIPMLKNTLTKQLPSSMTPSLAAPSTTTATTTKTTAESQFTEKGRISQLRFLARIDATGAEEFQKMTLYTTTSKPSTTTVSSANNDTSSNDNNSIIITTSPLLVRKASKAARLLRSKSLTSYELLLTRNPSFGFPMLAELSISPIVATGSSDFSSTKRHTFAFESGYCGIRSRNAPTDDQFAATSLAHGRIDPTDSDRIISAHPGVNFAKRPSATLSTGNGVVFSRSSLLQVIIRNPQDGVVAGIFVIKLDLSDMPPDSQTILRQTAYKSKQLHQHSLKACEDYLAKYIEIPLKRCYDSNAHRQRILLAGPIRVGFSFNRSNLRYTSARRTDTSEVEPVQKTRTVLQFPCSERKYFPLQTHPESIDSGNDRNKNTANVQFSPPSIARSNSLNTENSTRSFQHGSLL